MGPMEIAQLVFKAVCGCEAKCGEGQVGGSGAPSTMEGAEEGWTYWDCGKSASCWQRT